MFDKILANILEPVLTFVSCVVFLFLQHTVRMQIQYLILTWKPITTEKRVFSYRKFHFVSDVLSKSLNLFSIYNLITVLEKQSRFEMIIFSPMKRYQSHIIERKASYGKHVLLEH